MSQIAPTSAYLIVVHHGRLGIGSPDITESLDDALDAFCEAIDSKSPAEAWQVHFDGRPATDETRAFLAGWCSRQHRGVSASTQIDLARPMWREWNRSGSALSAAREAVAAWDEADRIAAEESLAHERQESRSDIFIERKAS